MAPKRTQTQAVAAPVTKKGRTGNATKADVQDPFSEACALTLKLLDYEGADLPEPARSMLKLSAPMSLKPSRAERHKFQDTMVTTLSDIFRKVKDHQDGEVAVAQNKAMTFAEQRKAATDGITEAADNESTCKAAREEAQKAMQQSKAAMAAASKDVAVKQEQRKGLQSQNEKANEKKSAHEKFISETWTALRDGSVPGKQWRERNRMIEALVKILEDLSVEESLRAGLPVALKEKPSDRGVIAVKAIEYCEVALQSALDAMIEQIRTTESELAEFDKKVSGAAESLVSAEAEHSQAESNFIASENSFLEACEAHRHAVECLHALASQEKETAAIIEAAQCQLADIMESLQCFEDLIEKGEAAVIKALPELIAAEKADDVCAAVEETPACLDVDQLLATAA